MPEQIIESRPDRPLTICVVGSAQSRHICQRAQCFAHRGHRVILVTEEPAGVAGIQEVVVRGTGFSKLFLLQAYFRAIRQCRPDVVHVHFAHRLGAWAAAATGRCPLVVSTMGGDILFGEQGASSAITRQLTRKLLQSADLVTVKSDYLAGVVRDLAGSEVNVVKVAWGVNTRIFYRRDPRALRTKLGIADGDPAILSPKCLQPFYNIHLIVAALPRILEKHPHAKLLLTEPVTDPDYARQIREQVERLGVQDAVRFVGDFPQHEMAELYSAATVAVAVPPSDALPQAMLEAMACQTPNVLSRLDRYREFVSHEETAYFVDISADGIAEGVCRLLGDGELRRRIADNGLSLIRETAVLDRDVERVERYYYELADRPPRRGRLRRAAMFLLILLNMAAKGFAAFRRLVGRLTRRLLPSPY